MLSLPPDAVHVQQGEDRAADAAPERRLVQAAHPVHPPVHVRRSSGRQEGEQRQSQVSSPANRLCLYAFTPPEKSNLLLLRRDILRTLLVRSSPKADLAVRCYFLLKLCGGYICGRLKVVFVTVRTLELLFFLFPHFNHGSLAFFSK